MKEILFPHDEHLNTEEKKTFLEFLSMMSELDTSTSDAIEIAESVQEVFENSQEKGKHLVESPDIEKSPNQIAFYFMDYLHKMSAPISCASKITLAVKDYLVQCQKLGIEKVIAGNRIVNVPLETEEMTDVTIEDFLNQNPSSE